MQKHFNLKRNKPIVKVGERFGSLVVCSEPYSIENKDPNKHRRQHVDCKCDCGNIREFINSQTLKDASISYACNSKCKYWPKQLRKDVPEHEKVAKIGEKYGYFEVIEEAFYYKKPGESGRSRCIKVKCHCGKIRIHREGKVVNGHRRSCGCTKDGKSYDSKNKNARARNLARYNLSTKEYNVMLKNQNEQCAICGTDKPIKGGFQNYFHVDHCHKTGKNRGLLCNNCNRGLGMLGDTVEAIEKALDYLKKNA